MFFFTAKVNKKLATLLSELHFALVSPSVLRMLPSDFAVIARLDAKFSHVKVAPHLAVRPPVSRARGYVRAYRTYRHSADRFIVTTADVIRTRPGPAGIQA